MASLSKSNLLTEENLGRKCWIKFKNQWIKTLYTPFLVCFSAQNLEMDTFQNYIVQNVYFLRAFAQAYEMAEEYADDDDAKAVIRKLRESVLGEIKMHSSSVQVQEVYGVSLPKESTPSSATVKYTDFLLATASGKVYGLRGHDKFVTRFEKTKLAAYIVSSMVPHMRLYAFLSKELQTLTDAVHPIQKWINKYTNKSSQAETLQTEELLDQLSLALTGEELDIVENLYSRAIKLETDFFLAQSPAQRTVVPLSKEHDPDEHCLLLFSDFDLTCTILDSSAILAELAIITSQSEAENQLVRTDSSASLAEPDPAENQLVRMSAADLRRTWTELSKQYTEEYEQYVDKMLATDKRKYFNYEGLCEALEQVSEFEKQANTRVIDSGALQGLNVDVIKLAGKRLILQDGCTNFFQSIIMNEKVNTRIHILSDCWCDDLIRSSLTSGGLDDVYIHANEFVYEDSLSTGEIVRKVESPIDKVQAFTNILGNCSDDKKNLTVYIGDSVGDLLCLLKADIGIVIDSSSASLKRLASHFGVSFIPLLAGVIKKQKSVDGEGSSDWKGLSGVLYVVSSWTEIHSFILGL